MPLDDTFYTYCQDPQSPTLTYATSLADFQLADRVALHPDNPWHATGARTGMVVGVPGGWVRVVLDATGKKVKIRCWELALVAQPTRGTALTAAIVRCKDFR
ncbi:hypothetical protein MycrhDRAFT_5488 [Mycolicibacterium rhodesiae JS60]|nr:hypothetical protein MycrhDRAFT_5488 [Mycolicibacterium rhodesiae JS60]